MAQIISNIISALYAATGVVGFIAYLPTIKDLLKKKPSANSSSYCQVPIYLDVESFIFL